MLFTNLWRKPLDTWSSKDAEIKAAEAEQQGHYDKVGELSDLDSALETAQANKDTFMENLGELIEEEITNPDKT